MLSDMSVNNSLINLNIAYHLMNRPQAYSTNSATTREFIFLGILCTVASYRMCKLYHEILRAHSEY